MRSGQARLSGRSGLNVLLVDTESELLNELAAALRQEGFSISLASDGREALQHWQTDRRDVVVLKAELPDLTGFEVCRQIRETGSTPVILVLDVATNEHVVQAFRVGADDWVTKPCNSEELALRIRTVWQWAVGDLGQ